MSFFVNSPKKCLEICHITINLCFISLILQRLIVFLCSEYIHSLEFSSLPFSGAMHSHVFMAKTAGELKKVE